MPAAKNDPYAVTGWGASSATDLPLPSGQLVQVRRVRIEDLIGEGILGSLDLLTADADKHIKRAQGRRTGVPQDRQKKGGSKDPLAKAVEAKMVDTMFGGKTNFAAVIRLADQIATRCVLKPALALAWFYEEDSDGKRIRGADGVDSVIEIAQADRESGLVYTDQMPLTDKFAIFQWAIEGVTDLKPFPEGD
jgi:hypothetical protein